MRRYLLDTTPLTAYMKGRPSAVSLVTPWIINQEVATSILVYAEVTEHNKSFADYSRRQSELRRLLREVVPYVLTYGSSNAMPTSGVSYAHRMDLD
jgi:predicted nucleic acid-binding protein